ncbi:MAG: EAL domain-containing protein, partial [Rhodospirillales bacterium]|nr:EAL domain-containing protein [Rhodospirillales bacterium]
MRTDAKDGLKDFFDVLSLAIEGSGTGIWDRNLVTDEIRYSPSWFALLGYDDHPSCNHIEVSYSRVHPDDLAFVRRQLDDHFAGRTLVYEVEHRLRTKDGSYKWVLSRGRIIARALDGKPLRMAGTTVDVTKARDLAAQLQEQTEALTAAHRLAKIGTWRWDLNTECIWLSPEIAKMLGRPDISAISIKQMRAMYHPLDSAKAFAALRNAIVEQVPVTLEYRLLPSNDTEIYVLTHAEPVRGLDGRTAMVRGTTQDITGLRQIEAALRESEDHYRHAVELHPQIPWTAGPDGGVLEAGPKWYAITGMTPATSMPNGWINAVHADDRTRVAQAWEQVLQNASQLDIEYRVHRATGGYLWMRSRAVPRIGFNGEVIRWYGTLEDITEQKLAQERLRYAAEYDVLTGTLNRAALFTVLTPYLAQRPGDSKIALLCLDLDYFKDINDNYGHPVGDEMLKQIAFRIASFLGPGDRLARNGGDEFMIMLAGVETTTKVSAFCARIAAAMQPPFAVGGLSLPGSVSIGAALASAADTTPTQLYRKADMALYAAKARARGSHLIFHSEMQRELEAKRRLRVELSTALASKQLFLEFQPILLIRNHEIVGVEALLRWQHPELGLISPTEFIPIAEETGIIAEIGEWVLREAALAATSFPQNVAISINVSPRQFELGDIVSLVATTLAETRLAPHRLKLEVTESVRMRKTSTYVNKLQALRAQGVTIVLDDFGSGYSSLSYLDNFRFDFIKIDKSFLADIHRADDSQPIFEAILAMTKALKIPITVEGVETQSQL